MLPARGGDPCDRSREETLPSRSLFSWDDPLSGSPAPRTLTARMSTAINQPEGQTLQRLVGRGKYGSIRVRLL